MNEPAKNLKRFSSSGPRGSFASVSMVSKGEKGCSFELIREYESNIVCGAASSPLNGTDDEGNVRCIF